MAKVEIHLSGQSTGSEIIVDGVNIPRIRKFTLVHEVGHAPVLTVESFMLDVTEVAGEAEVKRVPYAVLLTKPAEEV